VHSRSRSPAVASVRDRDRRSTSPARCCHCRVTIWAKVRSEPMPTFEHWIRVRPSHPPKPPVLGRTPPKGVTAAGSALSFRRAISRPLLPASTFVLMVVETLGDAFAAGWRITARCAWGKRDGMKSRRECHYRRELDLETLVRTRGPNLPLSSLDGRGAWWLYFNPLTVSKSARFAVNCYSP
jgi:hypothetical protein